MTEDPAQAGLNWYTYANNNAVTFIDPQGLDAIVCNQKSAVGGFGHMSSFVQDKDGNWFFFIFGAEVIVRQVDDASIMSGTTAMNKWLRNNGLNKDTDPDYDGFVYIPGDFTASLDYYLELEKGFVNSNKNKGNFFGWISGIKNEKYNFLSRNCTHETMYGLMKGTLSDGTSFNTYYKDLYGIAIIPNSNLSALQMAFMNSSYTRAGFDAQVSVNLQNPQSYLNNMYQGTTDSWSLSQAQQKVIAKMKRISEK